MGDVPRRSECLEGEGRPKGVMGEEQRNDPSLREAWERTMEGSSTRDSGIKLVLREGILYRVGIDPHTNEDIEQLVLPKSHRRGPRASPRLPFRGAHGRSCYHSKVASQCIGLACTKK